MDRRFDGRLVEFIALLKAQPACFGNSRFVLGNPNQDEPYGYCCTDGQRAFLALHNGCWKDSVLRLELNSVWGLPAGRAWDLYRWYPDPARLSPQQEPFRNTASLALRPFEIVLLEAVPHGQAPTLDRQFDSKPIPASFAEPSRTLGLSAAEVRKAERSDAEAIWTVLEPTRCTSAGGATLRNLPDRSILAGGENPSPDTFQFVLQQGSPAGHNLGRLRLSATTAKPPLPSPAPSGPRSLVVKGDVPPCAGGGMLVVAVEMSRGGQPMRLGGPGKFLSAQGTLAGQTVACQPALGTATYPSCWQSWRIAVTPSAQPQPFELTITATLGPDVQLASQAHFIPQEVSR